MKSAAMLVLCAMTFSSPEMVPCTWQDQKNETAYVSGEAKDTVVLKSGTEVKLMFAQSLSSKHATVGEKVELRVISDVKVENTIIIPVGSRVIGTVVRGKKNEKYGNSKDLAVSVDYIVVKGRRIKLTGEKQQKAKTSIGSAVVATAGLGLSGLMIYMSQREAWIREGTMAIGYIEEDTVFTQPELRP